MLYAMEVVNIEAIILMLIMLAVVIKQQPSRVQIAFILYDVFTMIFVIGVHLELLRSNTVGEALSGLCIQYVGQAGFLMAILWFASEFANFRLPIWVYGIQAVVNCFTLIGIFTAEYHDYFYTSAKIVTDGMYNRIDVTGGILWSLHYVHMAVVILAILILCAVRYKKSTPIHKKRIHYIAIGIGGLALELILKGAGVFGSYNPVVIAMVFTMLCMMVAMIRYGYFGSLHAAVDNAFNHGKEGLIILDRENTIIFINHRMGRLFPYIKEGDNISSRKEIMGILKSRDHMLRKDGFTYELRIEDIIENGEKNGHMLWFIDQTEYLKTMEQLREASEAKTNFLMQVSHELRTPMNTMLGMNEMINRETSEPQIQSYAKEVAWAGKNMLSLIEEVLDVSRLESGNMQLKKRPYRMKDVLWKAESMMRPQAEKKGISFTMEAAEKIMVEDVLLYGDDVHILQILTNLLSNAIKYTDEGYISLKAEMDEREGRKCVCVSVSDTGIGIQEKEKKRIFENFERGSNARKSNKDGMGLGLAIVKQLTEALDGTLEVESIPGEGSTFYVTLPWVEVKDTDGAVYESGLEEIKAATDEAEHVHSLQPDIGTEDAFVLDLSNKTILAVDDNDLNLMVLTHLLKRTNVTLETVMDGKKAVEACACKTYDLLILDHMMPYPDGIETLRLIRSDPAGRNHYTNAIALTANAMKGAEEMYKKEGFADYLTKPIKSERLEHMLMQYIGAEFDAGKNHTDAEDTQHYQNQMHILEKGGIDAENGLQYADGDMEFYQNLLTIFAKEKEEKEKDLNKALQELTDDNREENWNAFVIKAHGLKGEARGIGAVELGELFYQLEIAGKEKDSKVIEDIYPAAMEEWQRIVNVIKEVDISAE